MWDMRESYRVARRPCPASSLSAALPLLPRASTLPSLPRASALRRRRLPQRSSSGACIDASALLAACASVLSRWQAFLAESPSCAFCWPSLLSAMPPLKEPDLQTDPAESEEGKKLHAFLHSMQAGTPMEHSTLKPARLSANGIPQGLQGHA